MLNLITDQWIPVRRADGAANLIRPDQIFEPDVARLDWPRPDLNLAGLELLVGLVYIAAPPADGDDWDDGFDTPPDLAAALAPLARAFELMGDGPRFMQDFEALEGEANPVDMLFIDSAGGSTAKKNADLMVRRARYDGLAPNLAAMALFTLQAFAPSGGAGNRTSMRGGGPMSTLAQPLKPGLWPLIWANVPEGAPLGPDGLDALPWMRRTLTSEAKTGRVSYPPGTGRGPPPAETFFGQPRRLRLVAEAGRITGVVQRPWGANYESWSHPLTPYYHVKSERFARHPKAGGFGYRNWRGVILASETGDRPATLERYLRSGPDDAGRLIVGGWAMANMSPLDFIWSEQPVFPLSPKAERAAAGLVEAAEQAGYVLAAAVRDLKGEEDVGAGAGARAREAFFSESQNAFEALVARLSKGGAPEFGAEWLAVIRPLALRFFDDEGVAYIADLSETRRRAAVAARSRLVGALHGYGPVGRKIFDALELEPPKQKRKTKERA